MKRMEKYRRNVLNKIKVILKISDKIVRESTELEGANPARLSGRTNYRNAQSRFRIPLHPDLIVVYER